MKPNTEKKVKSLKKTLVVKEKDKMVYSNADWG